MLELISLHLLREARAPHLSYHAPIDLYAPFRRQREQLEGSLSLGWAPVQERECELRNRAVSEMWKGKRQPEWKVDLNR